MTTAERERMLILEATVKDQEEHIDRLERQRANNRIELHHTREKIDMLKYTIDLQQVITDGANTGYHVEVRDHSVARKGK